MIHWGYLLGIFSWELLVVLLSSLLETEKGQVIGDLQSKGSLGVKLKMDFVTSTNLFAIGDNIPNIWRFPEIGVPPNHEF